MASLLGDGLKKHASSLPPDFDVEAHGKHLLELRNEGAALGTEHAAKKAKLAKEYEDKLGALDQHYLEKLETNKNQIETIRTAIRSNGGAEPDSLLVVGNDALSRTMSYMSLLEVAKCEQLSKIFKLAAKTSWDAHYKLVPEGCKSSNSDPRTRTIWFYLATKLADSCLSTNPTYGHAALKLPSGWPLPQLKKRCIGSLTFFVRFVDRDSRKTLAQGFTRGISHHGSASGAHLSLDDIDFSEWPELKALVPFPEDGVRFSKLQSAFGQALLLVAMIDGVPGSGTRPDVSLAFMSNAALLIASKSNSDPQMHFFPYKDWALDWKTPKKVKRVRISALICIGQGKSGPIPTYSFTIEIRQS